jgi:hypothetical protein
MKYLISIGIVTVHFLVVAYACTPLFATFAEIPIRGANYDLGNQASIERALNVVRSTTIEEMRTFWSYVIWPLVALAGIDSVIIVGLIFRSSHGR